MGLDTTSLILAIEDAFAVELRDEEAGDMVTVGDMYDYLVANSKIPLDGKYVCLAAVVFHELRRAAQKLGDVGRLRPSSGLPLFVPSAGTRDYWLCLSKEAQLALPELKLPFWLSATLTTATAACVGLVASLTFLITHSLLVATVSAIGVALTLSWLLYKTSRPLAVCPPGNTMRELTELTLDRNYGDVVDQQYGDNSRHPWVMLCLIVGDEMGVDSNKIKRDTEFVRDLGCG